jgi:hypothetical protein
MFCFFLCSSVIFIVHTKTKSKQSGIFTANENIQRRFERALQHAVFGQQVVLELLLIGEGSRG